MGLSLKKVGKIVAGSIGFGVGGATGAAAASGNIKSVEDVRNYATLDAAGLAVGVGIANPAAAAGAAKVAGIATSAGGLALALDARQDAKAHQAQPSAPITWPTFGTNPVVFVPGADGAPPSIEPAPGAQRSPLGLLLLAAPLLYLVTR